MTLGMAILIRCSAKDTMQERIDKLTSLKLKLLCKDNLKRIRRQVTEWENVLAKDW